MNLHGLSFTSGSTDIVNFASKSAIDNIQSWTFFIRFVRTGVLNNGSFWNKGDFTNQTRNPTVQLRGNDGVTPTMTIDRATTDGQATGSNASADTTPANVPCILIGSFDPTGGPHLYRKYAGGQLTEFTNYSTQTTGSGAVQDNSAQSLIVGQGPANAAQNLAFPGILFEFGFYSTYLTSLSDIASMIRNPRAAFSPLLYSRLAYGGVLGVAVDESGNNNNGIITGPIPTGSTFCPISRSRSTFP